MKVVIALGVGAVGGFVLARVLEARAAGVPASAALSMWHTPILNLRMDQQQAQQGRQGQQDPDAPLAPSWYEG